MHGTGISTAICGRAGSCETALNWLGDLMLLTRGRATRRVVMGAGEIFALHNAIPSISTIQDPRLVQDLGNPLNYSQFSISSKRRCLLEVRARNVIVSHALSDRRPYAS